MKTFIIFIVLLFWARSCTVVRNDNILTKGKYQMYHKNLEEWSKNIFDGGFKSPNENGDLIYFSSSSNVAEYSLANFETPASSKLIDKSTYSEQSEPTDSSFIYINSLSKVDNIPTSNDQINTSDSTKQDSNMVANSKEIPTTSNLSIPTDSTKQDSTIDTKTDTTLTLVDSTKLDSTKVSKTDTTLTPIDTTKISPWIKTISIGLNMGYLLERNNPLAPNTDVITLTSALNFGICYFKDSSKFQMSSELHYLSSIQNESITDGVRLKRIQDDITSLHDFSYGITKNNKLQANLILRTATPVFTIYDGDYFKDYNGLGASQGFLSPYDVIVSPGIKYKPNDFLRMSISIYSFQLYGIINDKIADKGIFITEYDENCKFKKFLFKHLGAELNFWCDGQIKEWLFVQYRLSISTDFFESFGKNGLVDGLFITKIKVFKDFYISHQATLKTNFAVNFLKPFYNQMLLFSYDKSF